MTGSKFDMSAPDSIFIDAGVIAEFDHQPSRCHRPLFSSLRNALSCRLFCPTWASEIPFLQQVIERPHHVEEDFLLAGAAGRKLIASYHENFVGRSVRDVRDFVDTGYGRCFARSVVPGRLLDNAHHRTFLGGTTDQKSFEF
jgi:hypothetical protein